MGDETVVPGGCEDEVELPLGDGVEERVGVGEVFGEDADVGVVGAEGEGDVVDEGLVAAVKVVEADVAVGFAGEFGPEEGVFGHVSPDVGADALGGMFVVDEDQIVPGLPPFF